MREWARAIGHEVSNRGRIAQPVLDALLGAKDQPG
ncbi:MAG: Lsr2 family DNA-binding protein [Acidimicrobiales bacterium]